MNGAAETIRRVVAALDAAGARHMIVGSFASTLHGEPRTTQDIDIVVDAGPAELERFVADLTAGGWYADLGAARDALRRRSMFNVIDLDTGWKVDVILLKPGAFARSEFGRRAERDLLGVRACVATAEDTILAKLRWARESESERQLRDAAGVVAAVGSALDRAYIERWAADLGVSDLWARIAGN